MINTLVGLTMAAAAVCGPHENLLETLDTTYGEQRVFQGLNTEGNLLQLFINEEKGSWTVLMVEPGGRACIMSDGQAGEQFDTIPEGEDS